MFPEEYTRFVDKRDAQYAGDPNGDYIVAEHINDIQEAVERLEASIGLHPKANDSLVDRVLRLETIEPMRVPSIGYFSGGIGTDVSYIVSTLSRYQMVVLSERASFLPTVIDQLKDKRITVFGTVSAQNSLTVIQNEIGAWKTQGVEGIYLTQFGEDAVPLRSVEQNILQSIEERELAVLIQSTQWTRLLSDATNGTYNPSGASLRFPKRTIAQLTNFAYNERIFAPAELLNSTLPLVNSLKQKGLQVAGWSNPENQSQYHYAQAAGLLFSLDYLYCGESTGSSLVSGVPIYEWPSYLGDWRSEELLVFQEGTSIYRNITDGKILLHADGSIDIQGYTLDASFIQWGDNTVPGFALKEGTIEPSKLSTYDIAKIVELLNSSGDEIRIDVTKIDDDDGGLGLPLNIPASNMKQNVIESINRNSQIGEVSTTLINNAAIESLDAEKLIGDIPLEQLIAYVVQAVNQAATESNYLDVDRLISINLESTGTFSGNTLTGDNLTIRAGNVTENFNMFNSTITGYLTGNDGEFVKLYIQELTVDKLLGLKDLHVETLSANNMGALVLEAVDANIANGTFNNIVTQALESDTIKANLVTSLNSITENQITNSALFGEAVIDGASIKNLSAGKITGGEINTSLVNISSDEAHLQIQDKTLRIYDDLDTEGNRRLRVLLGDVSEVTGGEDPYGLVVLGKDGSTRLYDNTGVYNAGLHDNVISNEKIQEDAIDERVIRAGAIFTDALQANVVSAEKIATDAILARHIVAGEITGAKIAGETIVAGNIASGAIQTGHIEAGAIVASHIQAGAISADRLSVGFLNNLIRDGYDSFEQQPVGAFKGIALSGPTTGEITTEWSFDGDHSLKIAGNSASNRVRLAVSPLDYTILVQPGQDYFVSSYLRTFSTNNVPVMIGLAFNNGVTTWSPIKTVTNTDRVKRISHKITAPTGALRASVILAVESTNVPVFFDALQVEEKETHQTEPGSWKSTATTKINGDNIVTGRIDAARIHIGAGTVFGSNNDIIDITNEGIKAKSQSGWAMLNSKGLEIVGGAFDLSSNRVDGSNIRINGTEGIVVETPLNQISFNPDEGFSIVSKQDEQILFDTDPETGMVRISGSLRIYDKNNPAMSTSMDDKFDTVTEKAETAVSAVGNLREAIDLRQDVRIGMKVGYSSFTVQNANAIYFCGIQTNPSTLKEELVDQNGSIYNRSTVETISVPKQMINLSNVPAGTSGYIVWDNQDKKLYFIHYVTVYTNNVMTDAYWKTHTNIRLLLDDAIYVVGEADIS